MVFGFFSRRGGGLFPPLFKQSTYDADVRYIPKSDG